MGKMAPPNKFTRDEMVQAALRVVQAGGIDGLTAKRLAQELGTSTQPIFTCFGSMEAVRQEVYRAAVRIYDGYAAAGLAEEIPFYGFGMQYLRFAKEEPELYRLLFLRQSGASGRSAMEAMTHSQQIVRPALVSIYKITPEEADRYFRDLWLVVYGLAALIVTDSCPYSPQQIGQILTGFSVAICKAIKEVPGFAAGSFDRDAVFHTLLTRSEEAEGQA